jgi:hypothetical protein
MKAIMKKPILRKSIYLACIAALYIVGCKKGDNTLQFAEGTYKGKLIFTSSLGIVYTHTETPAYIIFDLGNYTTDLSLPNVNSVPQKGTYTLMADTAISFKSLLPVQIQVYPAPSNLNGIYKREYKGDSLILTLNIQNLLTTYQYRLKRY